MQWHDLLTTKRHNFRPANRMRERERGVRREERRVIET